jgi:hypothetical protein
MLKQKRLNNGDYPEFSRIDFDLFVGRKIEI